MSIIINHLSSIVLQIFKENNIHCFKLLNIF